MRGDEGLVKARTALGKWDTVDSTFIKFDETLRMCAPLHPNRPSDAKVANRKTKVWHGATDKGP
jgi:hypothetical protein